MNNSFDDLKLTGVFKAIVTDVSCFETTGKIKTRISAFHGYYAQDSLLDNYKSEEYAKLIEKDTFTYIMMPFGGGDNYGMFKIPPVNSVGLVTFINNNPSMPIWIGGLPNFVIKGNKITNLSYPSDKIDVDNNDNLINEGTFNLTKVDEEGNEVEADDADGSFVDSLIIKTKTNKLLNFTEPDKMDWTKNPVDNTIIINQTKNHTRHRITDKSWQDIKFEHDIKEEVGSIEGIYHVSDESEKTWKLNSDSVIIRNKKDNYTLTINLSDEGNITIVASEKSGDNPINSTIYLEPAAISIESGEAKMTLSRTMKGSSDEITLSATNVNIKADNIVMGPMGYSLVACPAQNKPITLEDGTVLKTIDNIKV